MASRKERKEALRRERLEREREAKEAARRKRLVGYGAGTVLAVAVLAIIAVLIAGAGGGGGSKGGFPTGSVPKPTTLASNVQGAARAAGCELKRFPAKGRSHVSDVNQKIKYNSNPPTNGNHYEQPVDDGAYAKPPPVTQVVHNLEHGRVIFWFRPTVPARVKGDLYALFKEDSYQIVLTPNTTGMPYQVAASAWNRNPVPNGTGRLLGCPRFNVRVFDALRAFRDDNRSNGPEPIP